MKTLTLSIIIVAAIIVIIVGISLFEFNQKNPITSVQTSQTSIPPSVSNIIIPAGAEDPSSGKNYEPRYLVVVLGINNTVKWTNKSPSAAHAIVAENQDDPLFWNATRSANGILLSPGKSFNFTFTKAGEFQYDTEPHPWMYGWVLVLPQSAKNVTTTVSLNTSSGIPGPCEVFGIPCPNNPSNPNSYNFTAQKFGQDIYIEEMTINGVDTYAILKPNKDCYYPQGYGNTCTNPDDLAILRLVGVNTSIPQEYVDVSISGLQQQYAVGEPIIFELRINGYGYDACEIPSVSVFGNNGSAVWQSLKAPWISCIPGRGQHNTVIEMNTLGGPFSINQTGTYTVHVDYASNSTEAKFDIVQATSIPQNNTIFGDFYQGIENDSGIISIKNQTYYTMTASNTTYPIAHGMTVKFHNVTFSFPYGAQATPGGIIIPFDMTFPDGTTEAYGNVTKNPDGSGSISGISLGPGPSSNRTVTVQSNHMHPQAGVTLTENQIKLLVSTDGNTTTTQTPQNHTLPASFEPCQDPYQQNYTGIPVLSMPENSTGRLCVMYHNLNDFPAPVGIRLSAANNLTGDTPDITTWNDDPSHTIPKGDSMVVYWVKTGNHAGFYGLTMFCAPIPLTVGYGNGSLTASDFPWIGKQFECPMLTYDFHINSTTGIGVRYIPWK